VQASAHQSFYAQGCFAIDYDFATHRCYFFAVNVVQVFAVTFDMSPTPNPAIVPTAGYLHCIIGAGVPQPGSLGLRPKPTVVHITLCEYRWCGLRPTVLGQDWSETKKIGLGLVRCGLGLGLAGLMLCCETRSCNSRRQNDVEGHSNFSGTIYSFSILCLEHHYCGDQKWHLLT